MDAYEIYNIIPKDGVIKCTHGMILGRRCWIADAQIGKRGLLMVDVDDPNTDTIMWNVSVVPVPLTVDTTTCGGALRNKDVLQMSQ